MSITTSKSFATRLPIILHETLNAFAEREGLSMAGYIKLRLCDCVNLPRRILVDANAVYDEPTASKDTVQSSKLATEYERELYSWLQRDTCIELTEALAQDLAIAIHKHSWIKMTAELRRDINVILKDHACRQKSRLHDTR